MGRYASDTANVIRTATLVCVIFSVLLGIGTLVAASVAAARTSNVASISSTQALAQGKSKRLCSNHPIPPNTWSSWGRDSSNTRSVPSSTINVNNVGSLVEDWVFTMRSSSAAGGPSCDATYCYIPDDLGWLYKIRLSDGGLVWNVSIPAITNRPDSRTRNVPILFEDRLLIGDRAIGSGRLLALKQSDGSMIWSTVVETHIATTLTSSGSVICGMWVLGVSSIEEQFPLLNPFYPCCSFIGSIVAVDVYTGQLIWKTYTMPLNSGYAGGAVWASSPSVDYSKRQIYISTGNLYSAPPGVEDCVEAANANQSSIEPCFGGLYNQVHANSMMALDLDTGAVKWARSLEAFEVWNGACVLKSIGISLPQCAGNTGVDFDFGQNGIPYKTSSGRDVVFAGQKSGTTWLLDAANGSLVWANASGLGGKAGGFSFGASIDAKRVYGLSANSEMKRWNDSTGQEHCGGYIVAQNRDTGHVLWRTPVPAQPPSQVCDILEAIGFDAYALTNYNLFVGPSGIPSWTPLGAVSVSSASNENLSVVFAADNRGYLFALSGSTGEVLWQTHIEDTGSFSNPVIVGSRVLFTTGASTNLVIFPGKELRAFKLP